VNTIWSVLLNGGILGVVIFGAMRVALLLIPRRALSAATRYVIWWIALAAVLATPVFLVRVPHAPRPIAPTPAPEKPEGVAAGTWRLVPAPAGASIYVELQAGAWQRLLLLLWIASSGLLLARLARSYLVVDRIAASAEEAPVDARRWLTAFAIRQNRVRIACSDSITTPVAIGLRRPAILFPRSLAAALTRAEFDHIGMHEAAHLVRRDPAALLLERAVEAIFWLHPAVRLIARQIDLEREIACDDLVVATTHDPRGYASCLARMVELCDGVRPSPAAAGFAEYRPHLSQRVELIMKQNRGSSSLSPAVLIAFAAALCGLSLYLVNRPALVALAAPQRPPAHDAPLPSAGHMTLLFDTTAMSAAELSGAVSAGFRFVDTRFDPEQQSASIIVWNGRAQVIRDFTTDRNALHEALRTVARQSVTGPSDVAARIAEVRTVIGMIGSIEGRKALLYIAAGTYQIGTDSDRPAIRDLHGDAERSNVAIYMIDARGLLGH
jgi:beta-lactamase regulating signal transducer with metallopeptidase domain